MQKRKVRAQKNEHHPENDDKNALPDQPDELLISDSLEGLEGDLLEKKKSQKKPLYTVIFFYEWCKSCGICSALCPQKIILQDETGKPYIEAMDNCIGCRFCEVHCPDFAITVKERFPDRRRKNNGSK